MAPFQPKNVFLHVMNVSQELNTFLNRVGLEFGHEPCHMAKANPRYLPDISSIR